MNSFLSSWANDPRLAEPQRHWNRFIGQVTDGHRVGLAFHADIDGLIGAAYAQAGIETATGAVVQPMSFRTDEYDFASLRSWLGQGAFDHCVVLDISLANHAPTMMAIQEAVRSTTYIYDHHLLSQPFHCPSGVILSNPTPEPLASGDTPVPTFAFALALAREHTFAYPAWLLLMAVFGEGVDSFALDETTRLLNEQFGIEATPRHLRKAYRRTPLPRVLGYVRAESSAEPKTFVSLRALAEVARGRLERFDDLERLLRLPFGRAAAAISEAISTAVDDWHDRIASADPGCTVYVIPVELAEVAGPVASILRGYFPDKVIVTRSRPRPNVTFELRTANDSSINLPRIIATVAERIEVINSGGHPSAAGALVGPDHADAFARELSTTLREAVAVGTRQ